MQTPFAHPESRDALCGFWPSHLGADRVAQVSIELDQVQIDDHGVYWRESRPEEGGRHTLCRWHSERGVEELIPESYSVRSRVHEYGGGEWCLGSHSLFFVNAEDQQVYERALDDHLNIRQVTDSPITRFADLQFDPQRNQLVCIAEEHKNDGLIINRLVSIQISDGSIRVLHQGHDFYASPAISNDGTRLAWLAWNHPHMPWVSTQLYSAERFAQGSLRSVHKLTSAPEPEVNPVAESLFQPQFSHDDQLYCVSDRNGWWNIHRFQSLESVSNVWEKEAEFGLAQWQFGLRSYDFLDCETLVASYLEDGINHLAILGSDQRILELDSDFDYFRSIRCWNNRIYCVAASATRLPAVLRIDPDSGQVDILRGGEQPLDAANLSQPQHITYEVNEEDKAHGYFYAPKNAEHDPLVEKPPVVVFTHGGPTATTYPLLNMKIQFWTQRGFAVADLNYRGSAGYGRDYRQKLQGSWGESDVQDCIAAVNHLDNEGLIDGQRAYIRGNSAGGYTTLCALTFTDRFRAGASLYGISDPARLAALTHKFESHYLDWLIGNVETDAECFAARTPLHWADKVTSPILFFQGGQDKVVLPEQTLDMVEKLRANGVTTECHLFPDEHHGFQQACNQQRVLEEELKFYQASL